MNWFYAPPTSSNCSDILAQLLRGKTGYMTILFDIIVIKISVLVSLLFKSSYRQNFDSC